MHIHRPVALTSHLRQLTGGVTVGSVRLEDEKKSGWRHGRELFSYEGRRLRLELLGVQKQRDFSWSPASRNRPAHMDGHTKQAKANRYFLGLPTTALAPSNPRPRINRMPSGDPVAGSSWGCGAGRGAGRAWCVTGLFCYPSGRSHYCGCPLLGHPPSPRQN